MSELKIEQMLDGIEGLPPLPAAITRLCALANDAQADISEMIEVISEDQALTSRTLRVANSAFYGLSGRVKTVSQAIVVLGFREVRNIALGAALTAGDIGKHYVPPIDREDFWRHALAVANGTRAVSKHLDIPDPEEAYVAGLMHDIGKLVFMDHFPKQYEEVLEKVAADEGTLVRLEENVLGMSHAALGGRLCEHWKIPTSLATTVARHHDVQQETGSNSVDERLTASVRVADNIAKIAGVGSDGDPHIEEGAFRTPGKRIPLGTRYQMLVTLPRVEQKAEMFLDLKPTRAGNKRVKGAKSPAVALLIDNADVSEIVAMILLTMGYVSVLPQEIGKSEDGPVAGLVIDHVPPDDLMTSCGTRGIPMLDLAQWRSGNGKSGAVNSERLQQWLSLNLRHPQ